MSLAHKSRYLSVLPGVGLLLGTSEGVKAEAVVAEGDTLALGVDLIWAVIVNRAGEQTLLPVQMPVRLAWLRGCAPSASESTIWDRCRVCLRILHGSVNIDIDLLTLVGSLVKQSNAVRGY